MPGPTGHQRVSKDGSGTSGRGASSRKDHRLQRRSVDFVSESITGDELDRIIAEEERPVVVNFGAEWNGPCKMLDPIFREIAAEQPSNALGWGTC